MTPAASAHSDHAALAVFSGLVAFSAATLVGLRALDRRDARRQRQRVEALRRSLLAADGAR